MTPQYTNYRPGKHVNDSAFPFLDSYPRHEYVLTRSLATRLLNARQNETTQQTILWESLSLGGPGIVCGRCGHRYWDLMRASLLESVFGARCEHRPEVLRAIGEHGHDTIGNEIYGLYPVSVGQLTAYVAMERDSLLEQAFDAGGMFVVARSGLMEEAGWCPLERDEV